MGYKITFFLLTIILPGFASTTFFPGKTTEVQLVANRTTGVEFDFISGETQVVEGKNGSTVRMLGADGFAGPGEPDLPGKIVLIGVGQEGDIKISFSVEGTEELSGVEVAPVSDLSEREVVPKEMFREDKFWPSRVAELLAVEIIRGVRVARVRMSSVQFNPVKKVLKIHQRVRVKITFSQPPRVHYYQDVLDGLLAEILLNGKEAVKWKRVEPRTDSINFYNRYSFWCRIKIESTGVYRITPQELKEVGFETKTIDPRSFRVFTIGRYQINGPYPDTMVEVPIYVKGEEDGKFDAKDYILFYARAPSFWNDSLTEWVTNYYTKEKVFWLTWGEGQGKRMEVVSGIGATGPVNRGWNKVRLEEDLLCPARGGLLWVWERYNNAGLPSAKFFREFSLPNRDTLKKMAIRFYGWTEASSTSYQAILSLNGVELDTLVIVAKNQGAPPNTFVFDTLPAFAVARQDKKETLGVELLGAGDVYLDYIEMDYVARLELSKAQPFLEFFATGPGDFAIDGAGEDIFVLDVTDPEKPQRVEGEVKGGQFRFRVHTLERRVFFCLRSSSARLVKVLEERKPGGLRTPLERADYYIVCPGEFLPVARLFARYREGNIPGLPNAQVKAVALDEIYDDYAFGMEEPGAIKAFLSAKRPAYGLLVGDATYDYKDNLRLGKTPGVPTYQIGFDLDYEVYNPYVMALEAWYADFEGGGSSPDMILARVTSRSAYEFRQFFEKVKRYESQELGIWAKRFLLLGDDEYLGSKERRESFIHIGCCEDMVALAGNRLDIAKLYLTEYPLEAINSKPKAEAELLRQLNLGALLWCFFGHGAGFQLCHERAFHIEDVPRVQNGTRNPLAFFGSCGVGRFDDTRYQAIAEELVRSEQGCIATMGASKATYPDGNKRFANTFFSRLLANLAGPIGPAFFEAWLTYNLYILFGDPATRLGIPVVDSPPVVTPDTFYPGGRVEWRANSQLTNGFFAVRATEAELERFYQSDVGSITYILPGQEVFRGLGSFSDSKLEGGFIVPRVEFPDTLYLGNGRYVRMRNSCRVSGIVWGSRTATQNNVYTILSLPLYLSPDVLPSQDSAPPELIAYAGNVRLKLNDTTRVPKRFNLIGKVSDPAGILLTSDPDYGLSFYTGDPTQRVELTASFTYDPNSSTSGRFSYPVELDKEKGSLVVVASDNYLNRREAVYHLVTDRRDDLRLDSCFVYPNPVKTTAWFTFVLSRASRVTIKVWSISGRLVRILGPKECLFGYNQIEWDGRDQDGYPLPNGVYLYKIDAHLLEATGSGGIARSTSYRDRFIIRR